MTETKTFYIGTPPQGGKGVKRDTGREEFNPGPIHLLNREVEKSHVERCCFLTSLSYMENQRGRGRPSTGKGLSDFQTKKKRGNKIGTEIKGIRKCGTGGGNIIRIIPERRRFTIPRRYGGG